MKHLRPLLRLLLTPLILLSTLWGALARVYRLEWPAPAVYALVMFWCALGGSLLELLWRKPPLWALSEHLLAFGALLAWWYTLQPYNQRAWANALVARPLFYNTLTANCTTIVFDMVQGIIGGLPVDHRLLLTGYLPAYVRDIGGLQKGFSLDELRRQGRITERARVRTTRRTSRPGYAKAYQAGQAATKP